MVINPSQREYVEAVDSLYLRKQPSGWFLGVSLSESMVRDAQKPTTWQLITIFVVGIFSIISLGVIVAQLIAGPVFRLVDASLEVGAGNLDVQVDV